MATRNEFERRGPWNNYRVNWRESEPTGDCIDARDRRAGPVTDW